MPNTATYSFVGAEMLRRPVMSKSVIILTILGILTFLGTVISLVLIGSGTVKPPAISVLRMQNLECEGVRNASLYTDCSGVHIQYTAHDTGVNENDTITYELLVASVENDGETSLVVNGDNFWVQSGTEPSVLIPYQLPTSLPDPLANIRAFWEDRDSDTCVPVTVEFTETLAENSSDPYTFEFSETIECPVRTNPAGTPEVDLHQQLARMNLSFAPDTGSFGVFADNATLLRPLYILNKNTGGGVRIWVPDYWPRGGAVIHSEPRGLAEDGLAGDLMLKAGWTSIHLKGGDGDNSIYYRANWHHFISDYDAGGGSITVKNVALNDPSGGGARAYLGAGTDRMFRINPVNPYGATVGLEIGSDRYGIKQVYGIAETIVYGWSGVRFENVYNTYATINGEHFYTWNGMFIMHGDMWMSSLTLPSNGQTRIGAGDSGLINLSPRNDPPGMIVGTQFRHSDYSVYASNVESWTTIQGRDGVRIRKSSSTDYVDFWGTDIYASSQFLKFNPAIHAHNPEGIHFGGTTGENYVREDTGELVVAGHDGVEIRRSSDNVGISFSGHNIHTSDGALDMYLNWFSVGPDDSHRILSITNDGYMLSSDGWFRFRGTIFPESIYFTSQYGDLIRGGQESMIHLVMMGFIGGSPRTGINFGNADQYGIYQRYGDATTHVMGYYGVKLEESESGDGDYLQFSGHDVYVGPTGDTVTFHANVIATSLTSTSDERLKRDIVDLPTSEAVDRIKQLRPRKYYYRDNYVQQEIRTTENITMNSTYVNLTATETHSSGAYTGEIRGFIAQEVQPICPECVATTYKIPGDDTDYLALDKLRLMADMVAVIKNLLDRVETLEAALAAAGSP